MTAKEMFEKLGYRLTFSKLHPETAREYQFIYESKDESPSCIEFRKTEKEVCLYITQGTILNTIPDTRMSINTLKAINKQIEELGWDNE